MDPTGRPENGQKYLCFSLAVNEDQAARRFETRFGRPPEQIFDYKRLLWLGPISGTGDITSIPGPDTNRQKAAAQLNFTLLAPDETGG